MDRAAFYQLALERLRVAHPHRSLTLHEETGSITVRSGEALAHVIGLENYRREFEVAGPELREVLLAKIVRVPTLVDSKESFDDIRVLLVPYLRLRGDFLFGRADVMMGGQDASNDAHVVPYHRAYAEHLGLAFAIERVDRTDVIVHAAHHGVTEAELEEIAVANLRRRTKHGLEQIAPGVYFGEWDDALAPERLLLQELWDGLVLKGDPVVFLAERESISVVGSEDLEALERAKEIADKRLAEPGAFISCAFVRRDGEWHLFDDPNIIAVELSDRLVTSLVESYECQKRLMDESIAKHGHPDAPQIMPVEWLGTDDTEKAITVCGWRAGVRTWLPRTHVVVLEDEQGELLALMWRAVFHRAPDLFSPLPTDHVYPPYWEPGEFPDKATFAEWKASNGALGAHITSMLAASRQASPADASPASEPRPHFARWQSIALGLIGAAMGLLYLLTR